jgi:ArsR family transcriptional regulator, arsenate/arsenite/antimonite-responsive transcriptional repressor
MDSWADHTFRSPHKSTLDPPNANGRRGAYDAHMAGDEPIPLPMAQPRVVVEPRNMTLEVLRALAHPIRLELVAQIAARGPLCSCHLEEAVGASQPQISKHLSVLHRAGLLERRREGRWVYYSVDEEALAPATEFLDDLKASIHRPHLADHCEDE